jgi:hypothetical protein
MAEEQMVKVKIVKKFTLTHDNGTTEQIEPGEYEWPARVAEHWYVKAHSDAPPKTALAPGTVEHARAMKMLVESRRSALAEAEALYEEAEAQVKAKANDERNRKPGPPAPPDLTANRESIEPKDNAEQGNVTGGPEGAANGQEGFDDGTEDPAVEPGKTKIARRPVTKD